MKPKCRIVTDWVVVDFGFIPAITATRLERAVVHACATSSHALHDHRHGKTPWHLHSEVVQMHGQNTHRDGLDLLLYSL